MKSHPLAPIIAIVFLVFLLLWACSSCDKPKEFRITPQWLAGEPQPDSTDAGAYLPKKEHVCDCEVDQELRRSKYHGKLVLETYPWCDGVLLRLFIVSAILDPGGKSYQERPGQWSVPTMTDSIKEAQIALGWEWIKEYKQNHPDSMQ